MVVGLRAANANAGFQRGELADRRIGAGDILLLQGDPQAMTHALSVKVVMLVAASLALGDALEITGATAWLAKQLAGTAGDLAPAWVLAMLMLLMGLLTNFVSNNAAAAISTSLGIELARSLGVPPEPFVLAVLFGWHAPVPDHVGGLVVRAGIALWSLTPASADRTPTATGTATRVR